MAGDVAALKKDNPVVQLEQKFLGWVTQQPEWLAIVAMPRQQRRAAMKELANRLYTIPVMDGVNTIPRVVRRKVSKQLAAASRQNEMNAQIHEALRKAIAQERAEREITEAMADMPEYEPLSESVLDHVQEDGTEGYTFPDPEGGIKADIEAAKEAESAHIFEGPGGYVDEDLVDKAIEEGD